MISEQVSDCYYVLKGNIKSSNLSNSSIIWNELLDVIFKRCSNEYLKNIKIDNCDELDIEKIKDLDYIISSELDTCIFIILNPMEKLKNWEFDSAKRIHYRILINNIYNKWLSGKVDTRLNGFCRMYKVPIYGDSGYNPFNINRKKDNMPSGEIYELVDRIYWTKYKEYNIKKIIRTCENILKL